MINYCNFTIAFVFSFPTCNNNYARIRGLNLIASGRSEINAIVSPEFDKKNNTPLPHEIAKYQSMITVKIEEWNTNIKNN